jgi:hypothetical protein
MTDTRFHVHLCLPPMSCPEVGGEHYRWSSKASTRTEHDIMPQIGHALRRAAQTSQPNCNNDELHAAQRSWLKRF